MPDDFRAIAIGVAGFGLIVMAAAFLAMLASVGRPFGRLMALGWVYIGMSIVSTGAALIAISGLSRSNDSTVWLIGLVPIVILAAVSFRLVKGAAKAFRQAQATRDIR